MPGNDAANLRLASRAWSNIDAEGLFNVYHLDFDFIRNGILIVRPWRRFKSIVKGLKAWPWMARNTKEVDIYLPDKHLEMFDAAADRRSSFAEDVSGGLWARTLDLLHIDEDYKPLKEMFSRLPYVESSSVLSKLCPFSAETEGQLFNFWDECVREEVYSEKPFGH